MSLGDPRRYLPSPLSDGCLQHFVEHIDSPTPQAIRPLRVTAAYHIIYVLTYRAEQLASWLGTKGIKPPQGCTDLILRVSGNHVARIKTDNEAGVLAWLRKNTSVPTPSIVAYDAGIDNPLRSEYILMTREPGESLSDVYHTFDSMQMDSILDQLIAFQVELYRQPWSHVGGLRIEGPEVVPGPVIEETFWWDPDISQFWPRGEDFSTLNISGPFETYVDYIIAHMGKYMHAIEVHPSLEFMRDTVPQISHFLEVLTDKAGLLNKVDLRLAHKDLHFANILVNKSTARITSILDWEFAGVVPYTRWNPSRAFLWNALDTDESLLEKRALFAKYEKRAIELGHGYMIDSAQYNSTQQENMQIAANMLRAIVEVSPRGENQDAALSWKTSLKEAMTAVEH